MPRKDRYKGVHTCPQNAGRQNMDWKVISKMKSLERDVDGLNDKINAVWKTGEANTKAYGGKWTEELLKKCIAEFFDYCSEVELKPTQPLLRLWLDISKQTMWDWKNNPSRYGYKSELINKALEIIEANMQERIEKYPTGNIFLLKTSFGHVETSKVDVTTNGNDINTADDVKDAIAKLGLDKKKD